MYKIGLHPETNEPCAINVFDENNQFVASIPMNPDNTDYQAYLKWVAEGNTPEPAEGAE
jgi:hypothetical protein